MKILFLTSTFHPLTGGAETYARNLTSGLAAAGHDVTVVTDGSWVDSWPLVAWEDGCRVVRLRSFATEIARTDKVLWRQHQYAVLAELGDVLGPELFDIVHVNSHETLVLGAVVAEHMNAALVASLHEQSPDQEAFGEGKCRLAYSTLPVHVHLAASRFYLSRAHRYGAVGSRARLVYHGLPEPTKSPTRAEARRRFGIDADALVIACAGRIYSRKGQIYLAEAFAAVHAAHPTAHLFLAGRVSDHEYAGTVMEALESAMSEAAVTVEESLTGDDMPWVFASADIAVQPSLEEGLGLSAIEAMQHGLPLVASDVVGLDEVVTHEHDGLLVPSRDPGALAEAIDRLIRDAGAARRMGRQGRATVAQRFSLDAMVEGTIAGYTDAIRSRHAE